jgi:hypothetical protein
VSYYSPYDLLVGVIATKLTANCKTAILDSDTSRVDVVPEYDFSGSPVQPDTTANKIIVRPDTQIGPGRGFYDVTSAIGLGPRTWAYHVELEIEAFTVRVDKTKETVRDITAKIAGRAINALHELQRNPGSSTTTDGYWSILMPADPFIQGGGILIKDAGRTKAIKGEQRLIVGFLLQYRGGS